MSISLRVRFDFTSMSLRVNFDLTSLFTSVSLRFHFDFTSIPLRIHFDVTSTSLRFHFNFTSSSLRSHFDFTSNSHQGKGTHHYAKGKRGNLPQPNGKRERAQSRFAARIWPCHRLDAHARTHDTKQFLGWPHPQPPICFSLFKAIHFDMIMWIMGMGNMAGTTITTITMRLGDGGPKIDQVLPCSTNVEQLPTSNRWEIGVLWYEIERNCKDSVIE